MSYLVLARKWRPQTFSDLIGQEHVSQTLKNAIDTGRVAHAFLFTGARGVGKTSSARILAKTLNCEQGPTTEPCNSCPACKEITDGNSVDVFEIDGASNNGVDEIRELRDNVKYLPSHSRYKIFIIDEVHMLSNSAFNALLKTLEEPPPHIKFIFATTEPHKVPITILSRCQRFDFKRIPLAMIVARLRYIVDQEQVSMSDTALAMVARKGDGSMRDSLSTLDQVLAFCGENVDDAAVVDILGVVDRQLLIEVVRFIIARDTAGLMALIARVDASGCNMRNFCNELIVQMRALLLLNSAPKSADLLDLSELEIKESLDLARGCDLVTLQRFISILLKTDSEMAHSSFSRLLLEMALIRMATISPVVSVDELLGKLNALTVRGNIVPLAADPSPANYRPSTEKVPARSEASMPQATGTTAHRAAAPAPVHRPAASERNWQGFVVFVKARRPMLGAKLEKASPLQTDDKSLRIGYPNGTLELSMMQEEESRKLLAEQAAEYFGNSVVVNIVALNGTEESVPPSIAEKKSAESARSEKELRIAVENHPAVKATMSIFGGEIVSMTKT